MINKTGNILEWYSNFVQSAKAKCLLKTAYYIVQFVKFTQTTAEKTHWPAYTIGVKFQLLFS